MEAYEGKAKRVTVDGDRAHMQFKDDATAFNGEKHAVFAGKGALNSKITEHMFTHLESCGVKTQHLGRVDETTLLVKKAEMIPLEAVVRFHVAGSLAKRTGLPPGTRCEPPIIEFYYKRDDLGDPILNDDHVRLLGLATPQELARLRELSLQAATQVKALADRAGLDLFDLKFEFGKTQDDIILADEISPDTCRLHDKQTGEIMDKDIFRQGKGDLLTAYREVLARIEKALAS